MYVLIPYLLAVPSSVFVPLLPQTEKKCKQSPQTYATLNEQMIYDKEKRNKTGILLTMTDTAGQHKGHPSSERCSVN